MNDLIFTISIRGHSTFLQHSPIGWDDSLVRWEKSQKYHGLFRSFSIPLEFVKEGAAVLRNAFYTDGIEAKVFVQIKKLDRTTLNYIDTYHAEVDFSTFQDKEHSVEVNLVDGGLSKRIKSREKIIFETDIDWQSSYTSFYIEHKSEYYPVEYVNIQPSFISLMDKLSEGLISSGEFNIQCDILSDYTDSLVLTNGYAASGGTLYSIKTSFEDFFQSINAIAPIGIGIEIINGVETLVLEPVEYFYRDEVQLSLGAVSELEISIAKDLIFNSVKVGFPDADYGLLDKTWEPNAESIFTTPIIRVVKESELTSRYRADGTGIVDACLMARKTQDPEMGDNEDVFFAEIYYESVYEHKWLLRKGYIRKAGASGTRPLYNPTITPIRCLLRHKPYIESCLNTLGRIQFASAKNENLINETSEDGFSFLPESGGFETDTPALFLPIHFSFKCPYIKDLLKLISSRSNGLFEFSWKGITFRGFILDLQIKLADRGTMSVKLLSSADNDLTQLIH